MSSNKFLISDASYCHQSKKAGLAVIDTSTNKKYTKTLFNIKSSSDAEFYALLLSVRVALKLHYQHVIFVYDCKDLEQELIANWLQGKIHNFQFLWVKREFVAEADRLAKQAKSLQNIFSQEIQAPTILTDENLLKYFRTYPSTKIIKAFLSIANTNQKIILTSYLKNERFSSVLIDKEDLFFYSDIYFLISKKTSKTRFYKYINRHYAENMNHSFKEHKSKKYILNVIKKIITRLSLAYNKTANNPIPFDWELSA